MSELAVPGAEVGRISATDVDLGDNAKLEYTILDGESGDTFNITGANQEAVIILNKVGKKLTGHMGKGNPALKSPSEASINLIRCWFIFLKWADMFF